MENCSGLSIASLVAALVAGPDVVPQFAFSTADWASFSHDTGVIKDSDNLGQNVDPAGNSLRDRDVV